MTFPKYPEYKDSGVEWLGEVPVHWAIERLKLSTVSCQNGIWGNDAQGDENDVICIRVADFDRTHMRVKLDDPTYRNVTEVEFKSREVIPGDLLLEKSGGGEKQPVGFVALYDDPNTAICANFIARIRLAPGMNPSFWRYVHAAGYAIGLNVPSIKQTSGIQNLDQHSYLNERAAYPPSVEQHYIASFLDHETARIDALVEEQQRLIELLKEKRQAVISHAVTKGLDPNVPMKDSGVEWLGEVPAHWEVRKLSSITNKITNGYVGPTRGIFVDDGIPYLQSLHIKNNEIKFTPEYYVSKEWSDSHAKSILMPGDVLVVQTGDIGQVAVVPEGFPEANCHALIIVSAIKELMTGDWLAWVLDSDYGYNSLLSIKTGALHPHLNCGYVKDIYVPAPPIEEQSLTVKYVVEQQEEFLNLISEAEKMIGYLKERRSALISAAVTGKIDVRGWQPPESSTVSSEATQTEMV